MIRSVMSIASLILVAFVILLSLPEYWQQKVIPIIGAISAVLIAYGIFTTAAEYEENINNQNNPANNLDFIDMQNQMIRNDATKEIYKEVYHTTDNPDKHNIAVLMALRMQEANDYFNISSLPNLPDNNTVITVLRSWANTPNFKKVWPNIKKFFKESTAQLITMLQAKEV